MNKHKTFYGMFAVFIGILLFVIGINSMSKPSNVALSFNPISSLETYFFGFVWVLGNFGWALGALLLLGFLILFYFIGIWIYKKIYPHSL